MGDSNVLQRTVHDSIEPLERTDVQSMEIKQTASDGGVDQRKVDVVPSEMVSVHQHPQELSRQTDADADAGADAESMSTAEDEQAQEKVPFYKRTWFRYLISRIIIRGAMITAVFFLLRLIDWQGAVSAYLDWIDDLPARPLVAALLFTGGATLFAAVMPGSYAPTVIAGATFGFGIGVVVSYLAMNLAALLNLLAVRKCIRPMAIRLCKKRLGNWKGLNILLTQSPVRTVILFRLPYLGSGILNYVFSLSVIALKPYVQGNAIGLLPGAILFASLGTQVRSLGRIISDGDTSGAAIATLVGVTCALIFAVLGLVLMVRRRTKRELQLALEEQERNKQQEANVSVHIDSDQVFADPDTHEDQDPAIHLRVLDG